MTASEYVLANCKWEFKNNLAAALKDKEWHQLNGVFVENACSASTYNDALHYYLLLTK